MTAILGSDGSASNGLKSVLIVGFRSGSADAVPEVRAESAMPRMKMFLRNDRGFMVIDLV